MRGEGCKIKSFREVYRRVDLLVPSSCLHEPFQMDNENLREPVDSQILFNVDLFLAGRTLEATVYHLLWLHEILEALAQGHDASRRSTCFPRDFNA